MITWTLVGVQCVIVAVGVMEEMPDAGFDSNFMYVIWRDKQYWEVT